MQPNEVKITHISHAETQRRQAKNVGVRTDQIDPCCANDHVVTLSHAGTHVDAPWHFGRIVEGKPKLVFEKEQIRAVTDCVEICAFMGFWMNPVFPRLDDIADLLAAVTGSGWTVNDVHRLGERIVNIEKAINSRAGLTRKDDYPPERMFEPIPSGPAKGKYLDFAKFERMLDEYYELHGWEKRTGLQTRKRLLELALGDVAKELEKAGKLIDGYRGIKKN